LHARYWPMLVEIARRKLRGAPPRAADEEDVAQQAFWSFYHSVRNGNLPKLANRHDLLAVLTHVTACKAINQLEHEVGTLKRGQGHVRGESALDLLAGRSSVGPGLQRVAEDAHTPDEEVLLRDCYEYYLGRLPEPVREVARLHLAGLSNGEIAEKLDCVERTVERKLALLRVQWEILAAESLA
jgi:DNA-directed RNA polymerase specialized sigma24 family protein